jgi:cell volume regulation protein A
VDCDAAGRVTSPTDAAAVFSVLRNVPIPHAYAGRWKPNPVLNDAPTVLLVMVASSLAIGEPMEFGSCGLLGLIVLELVGRLVIGGGLGWLGAQILRRVALPSSGLYPLAILVWTVFAYGITALIHASGFAAVYVCALILGTFSCHTAPQPALSSKESAGSRRSGSSSCSAARLPRPGHSTRRLIALLAGSS